MRYAIGLVFLVALALARTGLAFAQSPDPADDSLRVYAVHVGGLYGTYLGKGLIITAWHVVNFTKPEVRIASLDLPANVIKASRDLDLALLSVSEEKLPISLRMRRLTLCRQQPVVGSAVIVAIPEGTARSKILSPNAIPVNMRAQFSTLITHVNSTGNSGSGVFDAEKKCFLGVMSQKIQLHSPSGENTMDIAKYFVSASVIQSFVPPDYRF